MEGHKNIYLMKNKQKLSLLCHLKARIVKLGTIFKMSYRIYSDTAYYRQ